MTNNRYPMIRRMPSVAGPARRGWRWITWLWMLMPLGALAQEAPRTDLPKAVRYETSVEGISEYRLDNGLRVLLFPDASKQSVTVSVTYLVGSRHESYGESGMAHLLEHLLFKGTPKHPNIPEQLSSRGARSNATTSYDRTNYYETMNASGDNLEWALRMEADRMVNSFIAQRDLDSEMTVVRNEFESGENNPALVLNKRLQAAAYDWHNYGKPTIGNRSDIENVSIARLRAFYQRYYRPDNAVLLIAGRFDPAHALGVVAEGFGAIPEPAQPLERTYTVEPSRDGERSVWVRRAGDTQIVTAAYRIPAGSHPDAAALDVLSFVLADTPSGRLHRALVDTKKAVSVGGGGQKLHDPGLIFFSAEMRKDARLQEVREALLATLAEIQRTPPSMQEVERARAAYLKQIALTVSALERFALGLSNWMALGDWRLFFIHRDRMKQVSPEDVARVARQYLKPSNLVLGYFVPAATPDRAEIPPAPDVGALVKDYRGDAQITPGEAFDPSPENIEARTERYTLANGMRLALLPKKTRGAKVVAQLILRYGDEQALRGRTAAGTLVGDMLLRGTTRLSRTEIQDEFDRLRANVSISSAANQCQLGVETVSASLLEVLRLSAELLRKPAFHAAEFEQLKAERVTDIEERMSDPRALAALQFNRYLSPYAADDVRYVPTFPEQVQRLQRATLADLVGFYRDFVGASQAELAIVGEFDPAAVRELAAQLFGDWKSPRPYTRITKRYQAIEPRNTTLETPDKANAFFISGLKLQIGDGDPDYPALVLANEILGGGFLHSRFANRIRHRDGLSYSVGSALLADAQDRVGRFSTYAIYAPQNLTKLEDALADELARALREGFTAAEVAQAKTGLLQEQTLNRAQDGLLAATLASYLHLNRTFAWDTEFERAIEALSAEEVLAALRRHVDPAKLIVVKAGNFSGAK